VGAALGAGVAVDGDVEPGASVGGSVDGLWVVVGVACGGVVGRAVAPGAGLAGAPCDGTDEGVGCGGDDGSGRLPPKMTIAPTSATMTTTATAPAAMAAGTQRRRGAFTRRAICGRVTRAASPSRTRP